jgi:trehalose utilization protein
MAIVDFKHTKWSYPYQQDASLVKVYLHCVYWTATEEQAVKLATALRRSHPSSKSRKCRVDTVKRIANEFK